MVQGDKMGKKPIFWNCKNCCRDNPIDPENIADVFFCVRCGVGHSAVKPVNLEAKPDGNWLECIPLDDLSSRIPSGKTLDAYIDSMGNPLNREHYMEKFGLDPRLYLEWNAKGRKTGESL